MKLLVIALLSFILQTGITLTGSSDGTTGTLHWVNGTSYTIKNYTVRKRVNAGNLKNAYQTVVVVDGSVTDATVPLTNGKNTFIVVGQTIDGYGIISNEIDLK